MSSRGPRFRRNGKLQACEPCRKHKIRCDHETPVCGRCKKRKLQAECVYHPAPLTRPPSSPIAFQSPVHSRNSSTALLPIPSDFNDDPPLSSQDTTAQDPDTMPGFLGSTSFSEVWKASGHALDNVWLGSLTNFRKSLRTKRAHRLSPERIQTGACVVKWLAEAPQVKQTIERYYQLSPTVVCPWITMLNCLDAILSQVQACRSDEERLTLAEMIFKQTFIPLNVDENTTAENLHLLCTGPKLRYDIIGLILVYYIMGCLVTEHDHFVSIAGQEGQKLLFELTHASNLCVSFCERAESLNDILLWLLHSNVILLTFQYGDASHLAWRRLGDLSSNVFALGLHQEPSSQSKLPFFLSELRRIVFCNAYSTDKALATFFGRPPRISKRYCSIEPPHDITDDEIIAPEDVRNLALSRLDAQGWNTDGALHRTTWGRVKLKINEIREETLELSLGPTKADAEQRQMVHAVLQRSKQTIESIPAFARYDESIWHSGLPSHHCFMLLYYYLHVAYSEFLLLRISARHGGTTWEEVYAHAHKLLSAVLNISKYRDRIGAMSRDFSWVSVFYGLPPSALLAIELLRQQQSSQPSQVRLPRSEVIKNLSVFQSSLEWVAKPEDGNYELCQGAKQLLDSILTAILDNHAVPHSQFPQPAPQDPVVWLDDMFGGGWMTQGSFVDSLAMTDVDTAPGWEPLGNWPFEAF